MGVHLHRTWSINHICAAEIPWVWRDDARGGGGRRNSLYLISLKFTGRSFNHLERVRGCAATGADQESVFNVPHSSERSNHTGRHAEAFSHRGARVDLLSHLTALMSSELWLQLYWWTQEGGGKGREDGTHTWISETRHRCSVHLFFSLGTTFPDLQRCVKASALIGKMQTRSALNPGLLLWL